jgi:hypothetical protein
LVPVIPRLLAQEVVHRQLVADIHGTDGAAVDGEGSVVTRALP